MLTLVSPDQAQQPVLTRSNALRPAREYDDAPFCDSTVKAVALVEDGVTKHYLGLRAICEALGVDGDAQKRRIERNEVLALGLKVVMMATIQGQRDHYVLDAALVPFWLATMDTNRLRDDVRPKVLHFQRIAADVLANLWGAANPGIDRRGASVVRGLFCAQKTRAKCLAGITAS